MGAAQAAQRSLLLRTLHDRFAGEFAQAVGEALSLSIRLTVDSCQCLPGSQLLEGFVDPTRVWGLEVGDGAGLAGEAVLELCPTVAFTLAEKLLGGKGRPFIPPRGLTGIERTVLGRVVNLACASLAGTYSVNGPWQVRVAQSAGSGGSVGFLLTFRVILPFGQGAMRLCVGDSLAQRLAGPWRPDEASSYRSVLRGPLEVSAALPDITLEGAEVAGLTVGDVVAGDTPVDGQVVVRVAGVPTFVGRLGQVDGKRAITILKRLGETPSGA